MKIALIGQDIPMLLPALLADLLFGCKETQADVYLQEGNGAMQQLLQGYGDAVWRKAKASGRYCVAADRSEVLCGADAVIYAGDCQAASRFFQDRSALGSDEEDKDTGGREEGDSNPGLTDQARVNGGIGGLMHALRAGNMVLDLCDEMDKLCPDALVINLGQPMARITGVFINRGYRCMGLGRTPLKGANGLDTMLKRMKRKAADMSWDIAGLPSFAFLLRLQERESGVDLLCKLKRSAKQEELGRLTRRWLNWWDALPVGDVTDHAEFLPAQPDYTPEEKPVFGETVEKRKERILYMNTVREQGTEKQEGAMAQLLLLSQVPPMRPMQLLLAILRKETVTLQAVTHVNGKTLPQLPAEAIVETALDLQQGEICNKPLLLPEALAEILTEVDEANRLAARAAEGLRSAVREYIEVDPALSGLDRLYCQDLAEALIQLHLDVLPRFL